MISRDGIDGICKGAKGGDEDLDWDFAIQFEQYTYQ
jgi:hypothetical protein